MTEMIFDTCQPLEGYVWCSVVRDVIFERWQTIFPMQAPYDTTIILEHFLEAVMHNNCLGKLRASMCKVFVNSWIQRFRGNTRCSTVWKTASRRGIRPDHFSAKHHHVKFHRGSGRAAADHRSLDVGSSNSRFICAV
jgi:hypothetical protein